MNIKMRRALSYILIFSQISGCTTFRLAWRYHRAKNINYITVFPSTDPQYDFSVVTVEEEFSGWDTKKKEDRLEILLISAADTCKFKKDEVRINYVEKRGPAEGVNYPNGDQAFIWFAAVKCIY